ncbi:MAG: hypothetical protein M0025_06895 [Elusimicrobia bacterium]|nr:hypothetical protein [Elusimicrobiota bacterium]
MAKRSLASLLALLALCGCGARFGDGAALEKQGRWLKAAEKYRAFALANPADPRAPEALQAAAGLYAVKLGLCAESKPLLERLAREYPSYRMPEDAFRSIFICPDYFPAAPGSEWVYGDSQTLGKNARQVADISTAPVSAAGAVLRSAFYAGDELVSSQEKAYRFSGLKFLERQGGKDTLVLSYPLEEGKSWTASGPEGRLSFRVEGTGLSVKVGAGEFQGCVKISRRPEGVPSWIYEYYAPWTGKILTSVGGKGFENRVTELLSYERKK